MSAVKVELCVETSLGFKWKVSPSNLMDEERFKQTWAGDNGSIWTYVGKTKKTKKRDTFAKNRLNKTKSKLKNCKSAGDLFFGE